MLPASLVPPTAVRSRALKPCIGWLVCSPLCHPAYYHSAVLLMLTMPDEINQPVLPQGAPLPPDRDGIVERAAKGAGKGAWRLLTAPLRSKLFLLCTLFTGTGAALVAVPGLANGLGPAGETLAAWSPWLLRIGVSFLAAFIFAFLVKRVIKLALLVGGAAVVGAIVIHKLGLGLESEHVAAVKTTVADAAQHAQAYADGVWANIKQYLPSSGAAGAGMWRGARQKFEV